MRGNQLLSKFLSNPFPFIIPMIYGLLLNLGFISTTLLISFFLFSIFTNHINKLLVLIPLSIVLFIIFSTGTLGATIKSLYTAAQSKRVKLVEYLNLTKTLMPRMFLASLLKFLIALIIFLPAIYFYITEGGFLFYITSLLVLFLYIIFEYLTISVFSYISIKDETVINAFKKSVLSSIKKPRHFLPPFFLLSLESIIRVIPLINIISFFFLFPFSYAYLTIKVAEHGV